MAQSKGFYELLRENNYSKKPPTRKHRTAIWECMLGTVYGENEAGEVKYFDYDIESAFKFAGVSPDRDPRWAKYQVMNSDPDRPRKNQFVLWITQARQPANKLTI